MGCFILQRGVISTGSREEKRKVSLCHSFEQFLVRNGREKGFVTGPMESEELEDGLFCFLIRWET
jgi:hypothetical protein